MKQEIKRKDGTQNPAVGQSKEPGFVARWTWLSAGHTGSTRAWPVAFPHLSLCGLRPATQLHSSRWGRVTLLQLWGEGRGYVCGGVAYSTQPSVLSVVFLGYSGLFLADLVRPWALLLALESVPWPCFSLQGSFPGPGS